MSDLGVITTHQDTQDFFLPFPMWRTLSPNQQFWDVGGSHSLSGVYRILGTPIVGATVRLYFRPGGQLVATATTGAGGTFTFTGLSSADASSFYVVAIYDHPYNSMILDRLTPG